MSFQAHQASNITKKTKQRDNQRNVTGTLTRKTTSTIRSFRVDDHNWKLFDQLLAKMQQTSSQNLSASRFIKALIYFANQAEVEELLSAIKETAV